MSAYYYDNCATLPPIVCNNCQTKELGRVRSVWFQRSDFAFTDITDPAEWNDAICNQDIYVFPNTRGSLEMAETMEQGFGDTEESLSSYTFTLNLMERTYPENCDFWNAIKKSNQFLVGWRTSSKVYLSSVTAVVVPKAPVADNLKESVLWNVIVKFTQANIPCAITMPNGVFDTCLAC